VYDGLIKITGLIQHKTECFSSTWRKYYNEGLHNLYYWPNIIRAIKSRRMRWAGLVIGLGDI
jgi:hypothetical protein